MGTKSHINMMDVFVTEYSSACKITVIETFSYMI